MRGLVVAALVHMVLAAGALAAPAGSESGSSPGPWWRWREGAPKLTEEQRCALVTLSTKYDAGCNTSAVARRWPLLVTGTGRSGTTFTARVLATLGLNVSHDNKYHPVTHEYSERGGPFSQGAVSWLFAFQDELLPRWSGRLHGRRFEHVFHQVRHPLEAIGSIAATMSMNNATREFVNRHAPMPEYAPTHDNALVRALHHWLDWNSFLNHVADWRFRVEDFDPSEVCERAGLPNCPSREAAARLMRQESKDTNHRVSYYPITWEVLYALDGVTTLAVKAMACREYAYDCDVQIDRDGAQAALQGWFAFPLGVCSRVKNEAAYLRQWLDFHHLVGVSKFYMYFDQSSDGTENLLEMFANMGDARVRRYPIETVPGHRSGEQPFKHAEHSFRDHCLAHNPDRVRWMLFIDADEFAFPKEGLSLAEHIEAHCSRRLSHVPMLSRFFGSNGLVRKPKGLLIKRYTAYAPFMVLGNGRRAIMEKVLGNAGCLTAMATHYPTQIRSDAGADCELAFPLRTKEQVPAKTAFAQQQGRECAGGILLNHYATKSRAEYLVKYMRGRLDLVDKEKHSHVDRRAFGRVFGSAFLNGGTKLVLARIKEYKAAHSNGSGEAGNLMAAYDRFNKEWSERNRNEYTDTTILKYVPYLKQAELRMRGRLRPLSASTGAIAGSDADVDVEGAADVAPGGAGGALLRPLARPYRFDDDDGEAEEAEEAEEDGAVEGVAGGERVEGVAGAEGVEGVAGGERAEGAGGDRNSRSGADVHGLMDSLALASAANTQESNSNAWNPNPAS